MGRQTPAPACRSGSSLQTAALVCVQGYGLTETCAASFLALPRSVQSGTVGAPTAGLELRFEGSSELGCAAHAAHAAPQACARLACARLRLRPRSAASWAGQRTRLQALQRLSLSQSFDCLRVCAACAAPARQQLRQLQAGVLAHCVLVMLGVLAGTIRTGSPREGRSASGGPSSSPATTRTRRRPRRPLVRAWPTLCRAALCWAVACCDCERAHLQQAATGVCGMSARMQPAV